VMNKLAVLISGSFRNFESTWKVNESILNKSGIPYEVFFHTWDFNPNLQSDVLLSEYKNKLYLTLFPKKYSEFPQSINAEAIKQEYGFRSIEVSQFDEEKIAAEFNLGKLKTNILYQSHINSCAMYIGIDAVSQRLQKNREFSHFLRIRTDFVLDESTFNKVLEFDLVFFGQLLPTNEGFVGDQCFGGDLKRGGFILETLSTLYAITRSPRWDIQNPEILGENVIRQKLKPYRDTVNISFFNGSGAILRPRVQFDLSAMRPNFIGIILLHNFVVLTSRAQRFFNKLVRK
jgi:hypothetical protein